MDPMGEEQLDYGDGDYAGNPKLHRQSSTVRGGAIAALADDELLGDDDDFDDLYNDVNVGEHFSQHTASLLQPPNPKPNPSPATVPYRNNSNFPPAQPLKIEPPVQNPSLANNNNFSSSRVQEYVQESSHGGELGFPGGNFAPAPAKVPPLPVPRPAAGPVDVNGPTMLFVGELHWWTTDADLERSLTQYGRVKEIKFFDERASGKSKGYCQVEFFDAAAAAACKEGMDGYEFNGKACVVAFASPQTLRQMGASFVNRNQSQGPPQQQQQQQQQGRRQMNDGMGRGGGDGGGGRNFGRGGWGNGRGGQGMVNRGQGGGMRGRGFNAGRGMAGAGGGGVANNGPYGQGVGGPAGMGGQTAMMHPQNMMGAGFDPSYMVRGGPYGGFQGPAFAGMMNPFQAVNAVGLPGVAPHVNPAFFGPGMSANGMNVMGGNGMEGQMWGDNGMGGGWNGEDGRTLESSFVGDDGASDYGYGEVNHERGGKSNASREKERGPDRDFSGTSERRHRDDKEQDWDSSDRERHREEKDGHRDYRSRDRDYDNEGDWDRGQSSSRSRSKSYMHEDDHRSRSRDADYGRDYAKRRRE